MLRALLSLLLVSGVGVGVAYSQEKEKAKKHWPSAEEKFKQLNTAGDGKLTLKEFLTGHEWGKHEGKHEGTEKSGAQTATVSTAIEGNRLPSRSSSQPTRVTRAT